jgi:invasion protein IalB
MVFRGAREDDDMPKRGLFAFFGAAVLAICCCTQAMAERRVALVIGNSGYRHVPSLPNPARDAASVADLLKKAGFEVVDTKSDLGVTELRRTIGDFAERVRNADIAVVFYAGHGIEVEGTNYVIPVDAKLARDFDVEDETVSLDRILRVLEPAKRLRLVILDACRNNPFVSSMKRTIATRSVGRGLARVEPVTTDTLIAFAAKAGSTADDGSGENSPFTSALIKHLGQPGLDLRIAFGLVRDDVLKATQSRQEPFVYGSLGGNIVALVPGQNPFGQTQPVVASRPAAPDDPRADFEQAQKINTRAGWQAFLRMHPSGPLAERARDKLALLGPAEATPERVEAQRPSSPAAPVETGASTQLIYSPWTKFCMTAQETGAKRTCFTGRDARVESGTPVVAAVVIEQDGDPRKLLRFTLPLGMHLAHGTRAIVDQTTPMTAPYVICAAAGCMVDYNLSKETLTRMRKGQQLTVQAINAKGEAISLVLPLADFAKAYDGPPTDPKVFEAQQQKLQDELQRRAEEARRKTGAR